MILSTTQGGRNCRLTQFSSVFLLIGSSGGHHGRFSRDSLPVFSAGGPCEQFWHGQGCPLFDAVYPAFPLHTHIPYTTAIFYDVEYDREECPEAVSMNDDKAHAFDKL